MPMPGGQGTKQSVGGNADQIDQWALILSLFPFHDNGKATTAVGRITGRTVMRAPPPSELLSHSERGTVHAPRRPPFSSTREQRKRSAWAWGMGWLRGHWAFGRIQGARGSRYSDVPSGLWAMESFTCACASSEASVLFPRWAAEWGMTARHPAYQGQLVAR
jgi:hypothetical protein